MRFKLTQPMFFFSRVTGKNGRVRELTTAIDPNYAYCCILKMDAIDLGYGEVSARPEDYKAVRRDRTPYVTGLRGIEMSILITLNEVRIGNLVAKDLDTVALKLDLPPSFRADLILGQNFLKNFKMTIDGKGGYLTLV